MTGEEAMPILVLIVDNDRDSVADLEDRLKEDSRYVPSVVDFKDATARIRAEQPDIVVADLLDDQDDEPGNAVVDFVWEKHFCPLVIYSAEPGRAELPGKENPLVVLQQKGRGSDEEAMGKIRDLSPYCSALRRGHEENSRLLAEAMRDAAVGTAVPAAYAPRHVDTVFRAARRRFAATLDERRTQEALMGAWEQYLCPPLSASWLTGDILRKSSSCDDRPEDFSVVLTPSCDLVREENRKPKVTRVLVARCVNMRDALAKSGFFAASKDSDIQRLEQVVGRGYEGSVLFLPGLPGRIPRMGANLRDLDLLQFDEIGEEGSGAQHVRVASVDSPFRELVSWAYLQNAGRLGLPDRDRGKWAEEVQAEILGNRRGQK